MTKSYEEYENEQLGKAKTQSDAYAAERKAQATAAAVDSDGRYNAAIQAAEKNYAQSVADAEKAYRAVYDANVVNELVARRKAEEAIANANQVNSGLNNTQQTAISLQRGRADADTTRQKQATVDAIMRELDAVREQYNAEKTAASQSIYAQADADILQFKNSADAAARQNAGSLYTADQEAKAAQYAADQDAATDQAKVFSDEKLAMAKLGYIYNPLTGKYVKQQETTDGKLTTDQIKLVLDYMETVGEEDFEKARTALFGEYVSPKDVVRKSIKTKGQAHFSGDAESNMATSYAAYVAGELMDAVIRGEIDSTEMAELALEYEAEHGFDLQPYLEGFTLYKVR